MTIAFPAPVAAPDPAHRFWRYLKSPAWRLIVPLVIAGIAVVVLHKLSQDTSLAAVSRDAKAIGWPVLGLSFFAMCISYLSLSLYDVVILRGVTAVRLPPAVPLLTGVSSMAISNFLGFSWLTGGAIRYRIYASFGIDLGTVARLMAISWVGFFAGLVGLTAALMVFHPTGILDRLSLAAGVETAIGVGILLAIAGFFVWTWPARRALGLGALTIELPLGADSLKITVISVVDLAATALTLYVLMPPDLSQNIVFFFVVFVAALGLGVLSHSPGGLGVFDASIIAGLGASGRPDVLAALIMYRVIYLAIPFAISVIGLSIAWVHFNRQKASDRSRVLVDVMAPIVPLAAAALALMCGLVLLISGTLPSDPTRLGILKEWLPLSLVETSHLIGSVMGVLLLIVARGLYRRMFRAWMVAIFLLWAGLMASILKGGDWEEATTMAIGMAVLWAFRSAFYRADVRAAFTLNWKWMVSVTFLVGVIAWIGFFAYSNVQYTDALWWQFAWAGDASRFLRAMLAIAVVLAAMILNTLLSKQATRLRREPVPDVVRRLTASACAANSGISLSGDKRFLISPDDRAYIAYADTGRTLVSRGDPVGDKDAGIAVIWLLRELADRMGRRAAFYSVSERYLPTYLDLGLQVLKIGEVARVDLSVFSLDGSRRKDWRHAKARIGRDGYAFEVIPAADIDNEMDNLREVSDAWLAHKKGTEKGFSLGWFHPEYMRNFDTAVLRHNETGRITAFANLMQAGDRSEISLDLMRYDPSGPGMAMDALFAEMLMWAKAQGFEWFSLGAAPLSGFENHRLASAWHRIGSFLYERGERFYNFEGLRAFKQKFDPVWSPEYLASSGRLDAARVLYDVSLLVSRWDKGIRQRKDDGV